MNDFRKENGLKTPIFYSKDTVKERFIKESITKERFFLILIPQKNENRSLDITKEWFYKKIPRMNGFIFHKKTEKPPSLSGSFLLISIQKHYTLLHFQD